ncbi:tRNA (adenosine(37)-N6)-threonylcarbamoyltransferase complex dimerization subunit type 1 TsaB [Aerococcaceae bacterium WGS1372]
MKYIAFDSSTKAMTVALAQGNMESPEPLSIVASTTTLGKRQHGQTLAPAIDTILKQVDWTMAEIDAVIVGVGPGSYTGLRIGVTFAKVWAHSKGLPVYTVSSLALIAQAGSEASDFIIPIMDARRGTAYVGLYRYEEGQLVALQADQHAQFDTWLARLKTTIGVGSAVTLVGSAIEEFVEKAHRQLNGVKIEVVDDFDAYPLAAAAFNIAPKTLVDDDDVLAPNYAHETLAEREWQEKTQEVQPEAKDLIDYK